MIVGSLFSKRPRVTGSNCMTSCLAGVTDFSAGAFSTIESVRILLNSKSARHPSGVGDSSGNLGRYLCDHVAYAQTGNVRRLRSSLRPTRMRSTSPQRGYTFRASVKRNRRTFLGDMAFRWVSAVARQRGEWSRLVKCSRDTRTVCRWIRPSRMPGESRYPGSSAATPKPNSTWSRT